LPTYDIHERKSLDVYTHKRKDLPCKVWGIATYTLNMYQDYLGYSQHFHKEKVLRV